MLAREPTWRLQGIPNSSVKCGNIITTDEIIGNVMFWLALNLCEPVFSKNKDLIAD